MDILMGRRWGDLESGCLDEALLLYRASDRGEGRVAGKSVPPRRARM